MSQGKVNIAGKLSLFDEHWSPKVVGELNGQHVKLVKLPGEFVWHHHDDEDELFLVVGGRLRIGLQGPERVGRGGRVRRGARGVERRPVAEKEAHVMLFEPVTTVNTGNATGEMTVAELDRI